MSILPLLIPLHSCMQILLTYNNSALVPNRSSGGKSAYLWNDEIAILWKRCLRLRRNKNRNLLGTPVKHQWKHRYTVPLALYNGCHTERDFCERCEVQRLVLIRKGKDDPTTVSAYMYYVYSWQATKRLLRDLRAVLPDSIAPRKDITISAVA